MGGVVGDHVAEIKLFPVDIPEIVPHRDKNSVGIDLTAESEELAWETLTGVLYLYPSGKKKMRVMREKLHRTGIFVHRAEHEMVLFGDPGERPGKGGVIHINLRKKDGLRFSVILQIMIVARAREIMA